MGVPRSLQREVARRVGVNRYSLVAFADRSCRIGRQDWSSCSGVQSERAAGSLRTRPLSIAGRVCSQTRPGSSGRRRSSASRRSPTCSGAPPYATQLSGWSALSYEICRSSDRGRRNSPLDGDARRGGIRIALPRCVHDGAAVPVIGRPLAAADADRGGTATHCPYCALQCGMRRGRGGRLRQRRAHQREDLPAGKVRPGRTGHAEHRLQRPLLHVLGCGRLAARFRARSRPAVPARRHRPGRRGAPCGRQRGRDHAAVHAIPRGAAGEGRPAHRGRSSALPGRGPEQQAQGVANTLAFINVALALGRKGRPFTGYGCLTGQGNGQGGREHGQKADQLPGYRRIDDPAARRHLAQVWEVEEKEIPGPGRSAYELLSSLGEPDGVRALLVVGSNPVVSAPDAGRIEARLRSLDFLAVSDFFLSETAALAHVVLPSAQWAEEEGTMTNLEGRVVRRRRAQPPPPGARTDVEVLCDIAARLGHAHRFSYAGPREVFEELRRASKGGPADYSGISYEKIDTRGGVFWPCPADDHPGTPRPFTTSFATPSGRARFHSVRHGPPAEEPDADYPLYLTSGRLLAHYQSGTQTRRVAELVRLSPAPVARIHPETARLHGLADGGPVTLSTRRGSARFTVECSPFLRQDTVFVSFHWEGANRLTNAALDPVSRMPEFKVCAARIEGGGS